MLGCCRGVRSADDVGGAPRLDSKDLRRLDRIMRVVGRPESGLIAISVVTDFQYLQLPMFNICNYRSSVSTITDIDPLSIFRPLGAPWHYEVDGSPRWVGARGHYLPV